MQAKPKAVIDQRLEHYRWWLFDFERAISGWLYESRPCAGRLSGWSAYKSRMAWGAVTGSSLHVPFAMRRPRSTLEICG